nr:50S ribosomal protein L15P [uncultured archaeon]
MVIYKRRKSSRQRGSKTHGWGAMKKHRGSGNKGGAGMGGTGKKGDSKKPSIWAIPHYFGKYGFISKNTVTIMPTNISYIEEKLPLLVSQGHVKQETGKYVVVLEDLGFNKLLSNGNVTKKFVITAPYASQKAIEKIKQAGGEVTGLLPKKEKKQKTDDGRDKAKAAKADEADNDAGKE